MKKLAKIFCALCALFAVVSLAACAPKDSDAAKAKLEKAGYSVTWTAYSEVQEDGAVGKLAAVKGSSTGALIGSLIDGEGLTATLYDSAKNAKAALAETQDAEGKTNAQVVGKWLVYGNEDAIKAFKK